MEPKKDQSAQKSDKPNKTVDLIGDNSSSDSKNKRKHLDDWSTGGPTSAQKPKTQAWTDHNMSENQIKVLINQR